MNPIKRNILLYFLLCTLLSFSGCAASSPNPINPETPVSADSPSPTEVPAAYPDDTVTALPATPTPTMIPLFSTSEYYVGVFEARNLSANYLNGITDIDWVSADPSILQVNGNDILGLYAGTTTLTGTYNGSTVTIDVTVYDSTKGSDVSLQTQSILLFPEESFQLAATQSDAVFSVADPAIATVDSDGTVTAHSIGTTTVTAANQTNSIDCKVRVVADDNTYLKSSLPTEYPLTTERTLMISDSFYLFVDKGIYLPENILEKIEMIMATLEKETGLSYSNTKLDNPYVPLTKPVISVINHYEYDYGFGGPDGIVISPYDISIDECGAGVLIHELLHTLQLRNSVDIGAALCEGYAIYNTERFQKMFQFPITVDTYFNNWGSMHQFDEITLENMESSLLFPVDKHPLSYFFVTYLVETYGDQMIYTLIDAITDAVIQSEGVAQAGQINPLGEEAIYQIIKTHTSDTLTEDFYRYFISLEKAYEQKMDLTGVSDGIYYVKYTGTRHFDSTSAWGDLLIDNEITLDYTYAFDYAEKVWGRKAKGISCLITSDAAANYYVDATFYDQYDNVIPVASPLDAWNSCVPGAVKVAIRGVDYCNYSVLSKDLFSE